MIGNRQIKSGFTMVELLVGVIVFSLTITVAVGLFTSILYSQRKSIAIQNVQDNGRYLAGFMAKEIRMSEINNSDTIGIGDATLDITHPINGDIIYTFTGTQILRNGDLINSDEVKVDGKFFVDGKAAGDDEQPRVTIVMKVKTTGAKTKEQAEINLQTTLSSRKY